MSSENSDMPHDFGLKVTGLLKEWDMFTVDGENYDGVVSAMESLRTSVALAVTRAAS